MANNEENWPLLAERFKRLYTPAVCDVLDRQGLRYQFVRPDIRPLDYRLKIAGPAFTILGGPDAEMDRSKRIGPRVIDSFRPGVVAIYDTSGESVTGVWGELWSAGAVRRGCVGAVVDGGIRDTEFIRAAGFPIFYRFTSPADAVGRFSVIEFECRVAIGGVRVSPGDYVFGDGDGIVVIPKELTLDVLAEAEKVRTKEDAIRSEIAEGQSLATLYERHGKF